MNKLPELIRRAHHFHQRIAIADENGEYRYADLLRDAKRVAAALLNSKFDLNEMPIAFLQPADYSYVVAQWGIWLAGGIAVPICTSYPDAEIEYVLKDTRTPTLICHEQFAEKGKKICQNLNINFLEYEEAVYAKNKNSYPDIEESRRAQIIYTSGTTGKPKGVVTTHANIRAQIEMLVLAWEWEANDRILNVLPLHHLHGIVNVVCCSLWSGAYCLMFPKFDALQVWDAFEWDDLTVFMAVPTIYYKLIESFDLLSPEKQQRVRKQCRKFRLMVSGSAPLPARTLDEWWKITGHTLLERYGMTEIGMALSNSYHNKRLAGYVGKPLPKVQTRIVDDNQNDVPEGVAGELLIKSPSMFLEYWGKPDATVEAFADGWFKTGDIVAQNQDGVFKILGRNNIDIIKTGGYKVSALEIEDAIREHPAVNDCAVVGLPDDKWGQRVAALVVLKSEENLDEETLRTWLIDYLANYKIPSIFKFADALPRNAMGKVLKTKCFEKYHETN